MVSISQMGQKAINTSTFTSHLERKALTFCLTQQISDTPTLLLLRIYTTGNFYNPINTMALCVCTICGVLLYEFRNIIVISFRSNSIFQV